MIAYNIWITDIQIIGCPEIWIVERQTKSLHHWSSSSSIYSYLLPDKIKHIDRRTVNNLDSLISLTYFHSFFLSLSCCYYSTTMPAAGLSSLLLGLFFCKEKGRLFGYENSEARVSPVTAYWPISTVSGIFQTRRDCFWDFWRSLAGNTAFEQY